MVVALAAMAAADIDKRSREFEKSATRLLKLVLIGSTIGRISIAFKQKAKPQSQGLSGHEKPDRQCYISYNV